MATEEFIRKEMRYSILYMVVVSLYLSVRGVVKAVNSHSVLWAFVVMVLGLGSWLCMWMVLKNYARIVATAAFLSYAAAMLLRFLMQFHVVEWRVLNGHGRWPVSVVLAIAAYVLIAAAFLVHRLGHVLIPLSFLAFAVCGGLLQQFTGEVSVPMINFIALLCDLSGTAAYMAVMLFCLLNAVRCRDILGRDAAIGAGVVDVLK